MTRILLVGHGRMGRLVEALAPSYDAQIMGVIDEKSGRNAIQGGNYGEVDVAIDFTLPDAVAQNLPQLAARGINVVIGTTGWQAHEPAMRKVAARAGIGVLVAANFSIGMNLFELLVEDAAKRFRFHSDFGSWIHEMHHIKKKDAPSGTALSLKAAMENVGYAGSIDVSSTRVGSVPGTHTVGFDGVSETIVLTHT
ncbi:MAG: 4-hydroxy-tetrahydrodipicolinate reductase, partial [Vicinamibacterales bacterium]